MAPEGGEVRRRKLNFRRLLLNKCQEEFEKGDAAMNAVAQREAKAKEGTGKVRWVGLQASGVPARSRGSPLRSGPWAVTVLPLLMRAAALLLLCSAASCILALDRLIVPYAHALPPPVPPLRCCSPPGRGRRRRRGGGRRRRG